MGLRISIIVPVYNVELYLEDCIQSILSQSFKDFELILVNDGSKDSSSSICDKYKTEDQRVKVFHKENGGVSSARNFGIDKAQGDYICFIDSDDWVAPGFLEFFGLEETNESEDFLIQGYNRVKEEKNIGGAGYQSDFSDFSDFFLYSEKNQLLNSPCFKLFKASIVRENKIVFDKTFSLGEDHIFTLEYLVHSKSFSVSKSRGYSYRIASNENSLTSKLVDIQSFMRYISITHDLRTSVANKHEFGRSIKIELKKETNKWVIFLCHKLLDPRRKLCSDDELQIFRELKTLLLPSFGMPSLNLISNTYNSIYYNIMVSNWIKDAYKIRLLKKITLYSLRK